jgi:ERCC4-type nuclease
MIIKVDVRESDLINFLEKSLATNEFVSLKKENLPLGDIIINDGTKDCVIIERKTLKDLAASIKDGRYEEQSFRLNGLEHHNHNIYYLIEGEINAFMLAQGFKKDKIDKQTLYSAMFSISYYKGFSLLRSNSLEESAFIILNIAYKLGKDLKRKPYFSASQMMSPSASQMMSPSASQMMSPSASQMMSLSASSNGEQMMSQMMSSKSIETQYVSVVKKVKKDNITTENIGEIMLSQIPGVSSSIACAVLSQFKNLPNLIKCIEQDEHCLANLTNEKSRKINKNAIASIIKFLKYS